MMLLLLLDIRLGQYIMEQQERHLPLGNLEKKVFQLKVPHGFHYKVVLLDISLMPVCVMLGKKMVAFLKVSYHTTTLLLLMQKEVMPQMSLASVTQGNEVMML